MTTSQHDQKAASATKAPRHSQSAATAQSQSEPLADSGSGGAGHDTAGGGRSVSVWTMLGLIAGCVILVVAAINLPNLGRWGDEHGNVLVFLCFFLVMSIGGRLFWAGIDALWGAIRGKGA